MTDETLVVTALALPMVAALASAVVGASGRVTSRIVPVLLGLAAVASLGALVARLDAPSFDVGVADLQVDRVGATLLALVLGAGAVVAAFARRSLDAGPGADRHQTLLAAVVAGSAFVVVPGHPVLLVGGWIVAGWALCALVGHRAGWAPAVHARRRLAATLVVGDVALLAAVVVAVAVADAGITSGAPTAIAELLDGSIAGVGADHVVAILLVVAGASRSALFPFHRWLLGTLAAPTPVSALVHAGVVSAAGILLIRFAPIVVASDVAIVLAFVLGVVTVVLGTLAAAVRPDVKGALAWSTVAQMAFMVVQCAVGAFSGAVFHIVGHGMYKAALFLGAGDAVSSSLRSLRRPGPVAPPRPAVVAVAAVLVATATVGVGMLVLPPDVNAAGVVLVAVFGWLSVANALRGWLARAPHTFTVSVAIGVAGAVASVAAYLGGLRLVERWVAPTFAGLPADTAVDAWIVVDAVVVVAVGVAVVQWLPGRRGVLLRRAVRRLAHDASNQFPAPPTASGTLPTSPDRSAGPMPTTAPVDDVRRAVVNADVVKATSVISPQWPLASFVAVNPLGGLEHLGFDGAAALGRSWLGGRTHLSLDESRAEHAAGRISGADLADAVQLRFMELCSRPPVDVGGRRVPVAEIIRLDLVHGPDVDEGPVQRTALERLEGVDGAWGQLVDDVVATLLRGYVAHAAWDPPHGERLLDAWLVDPVGDRRVRRSLSPAALDWLEGLPNDPATVVDVAFAVSGVDDAARVAEARGHLARLHGWAGLAKWRTDWAPDGDRHAVLAPIEIVAVRAALEAALLVSGVVEPAGATTSATDDAADLVPQRLDAVLEALGVPADVAPASVVEEIGAILGAIGPAARRSVWLEAAERHFDSHLLGVLDRLDPGRSTTRPDAQLVFCIDVRSEGFRRHLEETGPYETIGFAGFFGVPMRVEKIGWAEPEARCPVLVSPSCDAIERVHPDGHAVVERRLSAGRRRSALAQAHAGAKYAPGAPFVMAESVGWALGPLAAARTLFGGRVPGGRRDLGDVTTLRLRVGDDDGAGSGLSPEQRVFVAEAALNTMGLTSDFAPLVVLCGHGAHTVNNPHATALECGACAGASGDGNARAVANLLNEPDVRAGLATRGIEVPDSTRFVAGLHDTVSDRVELLETEAVPADWQGRLDRLRVDLEQAGAAQSAVRAAHLPGPSSQVRRRGNDWAQVRPEWGLARNAAFVIGPRSLTANLDLGGRAFLHTYHADADPTGRVLETIMTAPLVVAHWISSQYYFSTVDPEVFGAGDKLLHDVVGDVGVLSGPSGDLRVGLPLQSTHLGDARHHQPIRLLAVVQAPLERIEEVIRANPVLQTLFGGSWMRLAGRSHPHEPWSTRTADGTWITTPRAEPASTSSGDERTLEHA